MSEMIRQLLGQRRGPMGLGNNPSPFPIPTPDYDMIEQPAGPEEPGGEQGMGDMRMKLMQAMMPQATSAGYGQKAGELRDYYQQQMRGTQGMR